jgi:hypothetical protein
MPTIIKAKIDLAKIHRAKVLKKDGRTFIEVTECHLFEGRNGALYLDAALFPTPGDQFGNDYRVTQDLPKAMRDSGERGAILGNAKNKDIGGGGGQAPAQRPEPAPQHDNNDEDVPF